MKIAGVNIPDNERVVIGLTNVYGIGRKNVKKLLKKAKVDPDKRVKKLTKDEVARLIKVLEDFVVEGDLRKRISDSIARLKSIRCYRGIRHILNLPARGQQTRTNARTKRGKRKTVGALKKEAWGKLEEQQRQAAGDTK